MSGPTIKAKDLELDARDHAPEPKKVARKELMGTDPRQTFFMVLSVGNMDGSCDDSSQEGRFEVGMDGGIEAVIKAEKEAVAFAKHLNETWPTMQMFVFKCVPIVRVRRGRSIVERIVT